ncbi:MAG: ATP-binding protein [Candidatus Gygaella obscura]|nr:ATP-binding protein [Candidatus Gygaella obscura]
MKQILVISGKGGTGKTVLSASFAALAKKCVVSDCDVDAADLHLLLRPKIKQTEKFKSGKTAYIDENICIKCGKCINFCRFDAITKDFRIDDVSCEGCAACSYLCPVSAIKMRENESGECFVSDTDYGTMVHARLGIAEENSGKLVSLVRKKSQEIAIAQQCEFLIIDGPPGIGCPVIASLAAVDIAVVVTEPTISGLHDAKRVIELANHFKVPVNLVINKFDLNLEMSEKIENYCKDSNIKVLGKIGFDQTFIKSLVEAKPIVECSYAKVKKDIVDIWQKLIYN